MYEEWLTGSRVRDSSRGSRSIVEEVESDRARVLYSAAFRRLQRKTQVFPLEDNAAIRTRLTHSLEVAHVGRFLASKVMEKLSSGQKKSVGLGFSGAEHAFSTIVEVACLLHDIGNPPFGHFGEVAVQEWFAEEFEGDAAYLDFFKFDGNPQGFRLITRLAGDDGVSGLNLTLAQLASCIKYPTTPGEQVKGVKYKKFGVFDSEKSILQMLRDKLGMEPGRRFCLAYLMEAADDISYCLSDIEDGVEKGLVDFGRFCEDLRGAVEGGVASGIVEKGMLAVSKSPAVSKVVAFRSTVIGHLVDAAATAFVTDHDKFMRGEVEELFVKGSPEATFLKEIKTLVRKQVYDAGSIVKLELGGRSVVKGLLGCFRPLLRMEPTRFSQLISGERVSGFDAERRLLSIVAPSHRLAYQVGVGASVAPEVTVRAHMVVDFVSGMTDPYALETYQKLSGSWK
jgi:dGTPase